MSTEEKYEWIERYLEGKLNPNEKAAFEVKMLSEDDFAQEVSEQELFIKSLQNFSNRIQFKSQLDAIHQEQEEQDQAGTKPKDITPLTEPERGKIYTLWQNYKGIIGIAATVAIVSIFSTILVVNQLYSSKEKKESTAYRELKKEVEEDAKEKNAASREDNVSAESKKSESKKDVQRTGSSATAFAITENGYLISTYHAVKGAKTIYVERYVSDTIQSFECKAVFSNEKEDIVILQITDKKFTSLGQLNYAFRPAELDLGEKVYTLAYPRNEIVYGEGSISARTGFDSDTMSYQISIPVNPGNSGSPLIDDKGYFVGIIKGKSTEMTGAAYAIKVKYIQSFLTKIPAQNLAKPLFLPQYNSLQWLDRANQIKQLQSFVFILKVYE